MLKKILGTFLFLLSFTAIKAQYTPIVCGPNVGSPMKYVYVGTLDYAEENSANSQKIKVDVLGSTWGSYASGETSFYIANRGGLTIRQVTLGSISMGKSSMAAFQNGDKIDFYIKANSAEGYYSFGVKSFIVGHATAGDGFPVTIAKVLNPPGTDISSTLQVLPVLTTSFSGNIGIGKEDPSYKLDIKGNLSTGDSEMDYTPTLDNISTTGSTILLNSKDYSSIGFHDSGSRIDFIRVGQGTIQLGYNGGWGVPNIGLPANGIWKNNGDVGIGTTDTYGYKLAVNGNIRAKEIKVEASPWPDYVFDTTYKLLSLNDVEHFIKVYNHLPEIPSAKDVQENGLNVGEISSKLLKKVEELTLYMIEQEKRNADQDKKIRELQKQIKKN